MVSVPKTGSSPVKALRVSSKNLRNYKECIKITVGYGEQQDTFSVHTALLTARSRFFKNALSGSFKEAEERAVKLPEDDPAIFAIYVHHLYTGEFAVNVAQSLKEYDGHAERITLAKVYLLGEKLQDTTCKNAVTKAFSNTIRQARSDGKLFSPNAQVIEIIYSGTGRQSLLRKLVVDLFTSSASSQLISDEPTLNEDFKHELLLSVLDKRTFMGKRLALENDDEYMEKADVENNYAEKK